MNGNNQELMNHYERVCKLYGICGVKPQCPESHKVTEYGLRCLNHNKLK